MSQKQPLKVAVSPVGPLQCNCTVIHDPISKIGLVFDPGGDADVILNYLKENSIELAGIIHTHGHTDHILASGTIKEATGAKLYLHRADEPVWNSAEQQCAMYGIPFQEIPSPDVWMNEGDELPLGGVVIHTPGHTPGGCGIYFAQDKLLVIGDTLFRGSIGRTDLPGGSFAQIEKSIREKLYVLDDDVRVITGHGPETTLGYEKKHNPYVRP